MSKEPFIFYVFGVFLSTIFIFGFFTLSLSFGLANPLSKQLNADGGNTPIHVSTSSPFVYSFNVDGSLNESGKMEESRSPYWWLNAGGQFVISNSIGSTIKGNLSPSNPWRLVYAVSNPKDTEGGYRPQNLFRLLTKTTWENVRTDLTFKIVGNSFSESLNRNHTNGVLLMTRYKNDDTLYYAGIRVDGSAVIKKKYNGTYYTLAEKAILPGTYDITNSPNVLPHNTWISLRVETITQPNKSVEVKLYIKGEEEESWNLLLTARDDGKLSQETLAITGAGNIGIRGDFMDLEFKTFRLEPLFSN